MKNYEIHKSKSSLLKLGLFIVSFYFLHTYKPKSFIEIVKDSVFANYQNKNVLDFDLQLVFILIFYISIFIYSNMFGDLNRFILFIVLYHSFETFKNWTENPIIQTIYLIFSVSILFYFPYKENKLDNLKNKYIINYLLVFLIVLFKTPPFTSGWAPSEWFKIARGYFGIFVGRSQNSAFMTPNSPRTFVYDFFTGGIVNLFGIEIGYFLIKILSILLVSYALFKLFNSLNLSISEQILVLVIFILNQDLIGGNEIISIFEEDRFAISFSMIAISYWFQANYQRYLIFTLLSIYTHIQIGLFWFGFISIYEVYKKNKNYFKTIRFTLFFSMPVILPTAYEFLFGTNEIVYAFNKTSSWVYAFIFQAYHVAPFEVDGIVFNEFLLRNWAKGFTNVTLFSLVSIYLIKLTNNSKLKYFLYFFIAYFPSAILLHYLDSKLSSPGQLANLFLFRFDTVFYLIILCLCITTLKNRLDEKLIIIFSLIILIGLVNVYSSKTTKYNTIDSQVQKTEEVLTKLDPEFILIEPNVELYTGSIELRTGIPTFVSQKYITNSLSNFPIWYEKLELRGRFFQGECKLFFDKNLEYFIGRENNKIKCGELLYPNGDYSIFKIPDIEGFNLPAFNSSCAFTKEEGEKILIEERTKNNLLFDIKIIYEESALNCSGKVIGTNLNQGAFVDKEISEIVLVIDK